MTLEITKPQIAVTRQETTIHLDVKKEVAVVIEASPLFGTFGGEGYPKRHVFSPTTGQTSFSLLVPSVQPSVSELLLNGVQQQYGVDYMLDGSLLTWLSAVQLTSTDSFILIYW